MLLNTERPPMPLKMVKKVLQGRTTMMYGQLEQFQKWLYGFIWTNPAFTTREILTELGTDGKEWMDAIENIQNFLQQMNPDFTKTAPAKEISTLETNEVKLKEDVVDIKTEEKIG